MKFVNENFKFTGMRKEQEFTIYPCKADDDQVKIQSDTRIALVQISTGKMILSAPKANGANFHHLSKAFGAKVIQLNDLELQKIRQMRNKMAGNTNEDGSVTIVGG